MSDDEIEARAEAWDGDPTHQRFYFTRYRRERRQRNRMLSWRGRGARRAARVRHPR